MLCLFMYLWNSVCVSVHSCTYKILSTKIFITRAQWGHFWEVRTFSLDLTLQRPVGGLLGGGPLHRPVCRTQRESGWGVRQCTPCKQKLPCPPQTQMFLIDSTPPPPHWPFHNVSLFLCIMPTLLRQSYIVKQEDSHLKFAQEQSTVLV